MLRCTNVIKEFITSEHPATATPTTAPTAAQSYDSQGLGSPQRYTNAEARDIEIQAEETAGLGLHDEGSREWQDAQACQVQRPECTPD